MRTLCQPITRQPSHFHPRKPHALISLFSFVRFPFFLSFGIFPTSLCHDFLSPALFWSFFFPLICSFGFYLMLFSLFYFLLLLLLHPSFFHPSFLQFFLLSIFPSSLPSSRPIFPPPMWTRLSAARREQVQVSLLLRITSAHAVMLFFAITTHDITSSCLLHEGVYSL